MSTQTLIRASVVLVFIALGGHPLWGACIGPASLEAGLHSHPDAETNIQLGVWFGDHHKYDCAIESFKAALKFEPSSPRVFYLIGLSYYLSGEASEAVASLENSVRLDSKNLDSQLIFAAALSQLGRNAEAQTHWEAALLIDPTSKVAMDGLSKCLIAVGQYDAVIGLLSPTPRNEAMTLDLALAYVRTGNLDGASDVLSQALTASPSSVPLANALVTVYVSQNRHQEAIKLAERMAQSHPGNVVAQTMYLRVLILNDDFARAQPLGRKLRTTAPHEFEVLYLSGVLEREAGNLAAARSFLEQAVALNPSHYNSRYNLGVVLSHLKDYGAAKEQLEKAIELGGIEPQIRFELVTVLRKLGESQPAEEQLKLYQKELQERANRTLAAGKDSEASQALAKGDAQTAVALYKAAVAATPSDALLNYKLALALDQIGDTTSERNALEKAVELDPNLAVAQNQLGYLASLQGDLHSAEERFRLALQAAPGYTQAWISLAATLAMQSRFPEAQSAVEIALRLDPQNTAAIQLRRDLTGGQGSPH